MLSDANVFPTEHDNRVSAIDGREIKRVLGSIWKEVVDLLPWEMRNAWLILVGNPEGRLSSRWEDNFEMDVENICCNAMNRILLF